MLAYGDHSNLNVLPKFIWMMIVPILVLLVWAQNKLADSNEANHYSEGEEELAGTSNETDQLFEQYLEQTGAQVVSASRACSFCGKSSGVTTKCSRCKAALYCSKVCRNMHWRFGHEYDCVGIEVAEDQEGSPSHGAHSLLMEADNKTDAGEVSYIQAREGVEYASPDATAKSQFANVSDRKRCAVCGNPSTKKCSRCKAIKYCSTTCQHLDWRSGHRFQCDAVSANLTHVATINHERLAHGNVVEAANSYAMEDNDHSSGPLCLEFYSEGNINAKALILSSKEATNDTSESQKGTEEQVRSLKEELEKIRNESISLQSERDNWEMKARYAADRLHNFQKENEHQLLVLKHENDLISNAEKQARQMLCSLSQRLNYLQIEMETRVDEMEKQEERIHSLQNECAKVKTELQEQRKCVQRIVVELDEAAQFPRRMAEETRKGVWNSDANSSVATIIKDKIDHLVSKITKPDDKGIQARSLSRNLTYNRQACVICFNNEKDMAFGCGHMTCRDCGSKIRKCHICRKKITNRIRLFHG